MPIESVARTLRSAGFDSIRIRFSWEASTWPATAQTCIKEENINSIFEAFFTTKDSVKDVGLGLSVCYGFIQDHGGDIRVSSQVGEGTTFTIILPEHSE